MSREEIPLGAKWIDERGVICDLVLLATVTMTKRLYQSYSPSFEEHKSQYGMAHKDIRGGQKNHEQSRQQFRSTHKLLAHHFSATA